MMNDETSISRRLSMLVVLVIYIFFILFISMGISGIILYMLVRVGAISPLNFNRLPGLLLGLLFVSLLIGIIAGIIGGKHFLRPIRKLIEATNEIASGNFDVHVDYGFGGRYEIERLAASFNEMAKELSSIETLRNDFVSNISHEYKTPIAAIRGFARRLEKENLTKEERAEYLDIIISESERLTQLSNNVLLLTRLENLDSVYEKSEYSLDEQLRRSILLLDHQMSVKQLELESEIEPVLIYANEEVLNHMWLNLLSNAVKFSLNGGTIGVKLWVSGDYAIAKISDTGIGMDSEVLRRIFDKFYQGDSSRATEGNGLGLSLVKRILELENGTIDVYSEVDKGSIFTVSLPIDH
ncbi:MAG: HAMP domain-containing histidine kinase [Oscillospiraceae bacterium]|nr:HAMP domain-containing histidine kinase [Oscillospiraceae bacterium]